MTDLRDLLDRALAGETRARLRLVRGHLSVPGAIQFHHLLAQHIDGHPTALDAARALADGMVAADAILSDAEAKAANLFHGVTV